MEDHGKYPFEKPKLSKDLEIVDIALGKTEFDYAEFLERCKGLENDCHMTESQIAKAFGISTVQLRTIKHICTYKLKNP